MWLSPSHTASGIPGTASNLPDPAPPPVTTGGGTSRKTENVNYQTSRTVKRTVLPQGAIKRLSVSVLIDQEVHFEGTGAQAKRVLTAAHAGTHQSDSRSGGCRGRLQHGARRSVDRRKPALRIDGESGSAGHTCAASGGRRADSARAAEEESENADRGRSGRSGAAGRTVLPDFQDAEEITGRECASAHGIAAAVARSGHAESWRRGYMGALAARAPRLSRHSRRRASKY